MDTPFYKGEIVYITKSLLKRYRTEYLIELYEEANKQKNTESYNNILDAIAEVITERLDNKSEAC